MSTTTSPEEVRGGLAVVMAAGAQEIVSVAQQSSPDQVVANLFDLTPLIVGDYMEAAAALGLDWYDELRDAAGAAPNFTPTPVVNLREEFLANAVGWATRSLRDLTADFERELDAAVAKLLPAIEAEIATALRETVTENAEDDPESAGWRRIARPGACPFCRMLADKGAIFSAGTSRFAAHKNCHCLAQPMFGRRGGEEASVVQYAASTKRRTDADRAALRAYLRENYGT